MVVDDHPAIGGFDITLVPFEAGEVGEASGGFDDEVAFVLCPALGVDDETLIELLMLDGGSLVTRLMLAA